MTGDDLTQIVHLLGHRRPFRPFLIEFNSGDRLRVSHPEAIERRDELFLHRGPDLEHRIFAASSVSQLIVPSPSMPGP